MEKKVKIRYIIGCFIASFILVFLFHCDEWLDIGRYYEMAEVEQSYGMMGIIALHIAQGIDFIYYALLYLFHSGGFPYDFVTIIFVGLYWLLILLLINQNHDLKAEPKILWIYALCSVPLVWVVAISRTTAALCFLYAAVLFAYKKKWILSIVLMILSFFTHVSMFLFIGICLCAVILKRIYEKKHFSSTFFLFISILLALSLPSIFSKMVEMFGDIFKTENYMNYAGGSSIKSGILNWSNVGKGEKASMVLCLLYSVLIVISNKSKKYSFWVLYICIVFLSLSLASSQMMTNRIMLFLPPFIGATLLDSFSENKKDRKLLLMMSAVGLMAALLTFYNFRYLFYIGTFE